MPYFVILSGSNLEINQDWYKMTFGGWQSHLWRFSRTYCCRQEEGLGSFAKEFWWNIAIISHQNINEDSRSREALQLFHIKASTVSLHFFRQSAALGYQRKCSGGHYNYLAISSLAPFIPVIPPTPFASPAEQVFSCKLLLSRTQPQYFMPCTNLGR